MEPKVVVSQIGIQKKVCTHDCDKPLCSRAHPNYTGSVVKHPQWCLRGWVQTCGEKNCPFNHFRHESGFVYYRMNDKAWREKNQDLVLKYKINENCYSKVAREKSPELQEGDFPALTPAPVKQTPCLSYANIIKK
jgi:hypothetical protein